MIRQDTAWLLKEKYSGIETPAFLTDCARLDAGEPLAYLIGHTPFLNCTIHLDSHPLIPRPETEFWVEQAIKTIKNHRSGRDLVHNRGETSIVTAPLTVLDLCAGSGAIGVAVATAIPDAHVTFTELDPAHLPTIKKNLLANLPITTTVHQPTTLTTAINRSSEVLFLHEGQYRIFAADLFSALTSNQSTSSSPTTAINRSSVEIGCGYDFIFSNPPYIDAAANTVDESVTEFEPHLALFGGVAGMELITRIIAEAPEYLVPTGQLWLEHEPAHVEAIAVLAATYGFSVVTHPDQYSVPRFSVLSMAQ